jgi:hypothetical protein
MSDEKQETKTTGFAARMKKILGGSCGGGCCCSDVRIVPKETEQDDDRE